MKFTIALALCAIATAAPGADLVQTVPGFNATNFKVRHQNLERRTACVNDKKRCFPTTKQIKFLPPGLFRLSHSPGALQAE